MRYEMLANMTDSFAIACDDVPVGTLTAWVPVTEEQLRADYEMDKCAYEAGATEQPVPATFEEYVNELATSNRLRMAG